MQSRDNGDNPLLQTITKVFGASVWFNAIVVLTHAASAPPDGLNGIPLSYEMFVTQRSHVVQQVIRQAAGDIRLMNPVSLVENHAACRTNRAGQRVLPNGQVWKPQLLLLCFASKVLAEANVLLKLQDSPIGKLSRTRIPPLPFLVSSLLQSRAPLKLPEEQFGDDDCNTPGLTITRTVCCCLRTVCPRTSNVPCFTYAETKLRRSPPRAGRRAYSRPSRTLH